MRKWLCHSLRSGDLALQGAAIVEADAELVQLMNSAAMERHQASNWLSGHAELYSKTLYDGLPRRLPRPSRTDVPFATAGRFSSTLSPNLAIDFGLTRIRRPRKAIVHGHRENGRSICYSGAI
jgi:hypothetical protein